MPDKKEFIALFKVEAEEYVTKLDQGFVELEKDPGKLELAKELSLVVHTLKGAARVFGFLQIQDIAHGIEDILAKANQRKLVINSLVAGKIFKALDSIRAILENVLKEEKVGIDVTDVCLGLKSCLGQETEDREKKIVTKEEERMQAEKQAMPNKIYNTKAASSAEEYIRVPISRVNKILNLSGEIVINKMKTSAKIAHVKTLCILAKRIQKAVVSLSETINTEFHHPSEKSARLLGECSADIQKFKDDSLVLWDNLSTEAFHLDPVIDELQSTMKEMRMLPLSTIFEGFSRMVRDISSEKAKDVNFEISGEETELDKKVLEGIKDPIIHILRNCIDHGIENPDERVSLGKPRCGNIKLSAYHQAGSVVIRIEDDGKGIDLGQIKRTALKKNLVSLEVLERMTEKEIINIVFMSGYSTSPIITDVSGRGLGLDIARRGIENLKGQINLDTERDLGTSFTLILPLTIAIMQVLLLKTQGILFALPLSSVTENLTVKMEDVSTVGVRMAIQVRGHTIALVRLEEVLGLQISPINQTERKLYAKEELNLVIVSSFDKKVGFIVDEIVGEEEVFIKSLGKHLGKIKNVSGATILWTGEVVVILDAEDLLVNSRLGHPSVMGAKTASSQKSKGKRILVVEDTVSTRELEKIILEEDGYLVDIAVDGLDGLERVSKVKYDLIISDVQMPRMDGFGLCENVKKIDAYKDVPIIIITALEKEEDKRHGIQAGAAAYITKNAFDQSTLLDTIERLIG